MKKMTFRTVWFVTRPLRDPNYFPNALEALKIATDDFTEKWNANRPIQKKYEAVLAEKELKRNNISNDGSGGRTWAAMLRTYSLIYLDEAGRLVPTKVGLELLKGHKKFENLSKQLLTLQIPNSYFESAGFRPKYAPDFKVRPIHFLIRLVCQEPLDYYLTREEITFFAMTARNDGQLNEVVKKIVQYRNANDTEKEEMKDQISKLEYRTRKDSGARDFKEAHGDVAHTFMLQAGYTELVEYENGKLFVDKDSEQLETTLEELDRYEQRYPFNVRYKISEVRFGEHAGLDVDSYKSRVVTTEKVASNQGKEDKMIQEKLKKYPNLHFQKLDEIIAILSEDFPPKKAEKIALKVMEKKQELSRINDGFITSYLNQPDNLEFENQTAEILKSLGFEVTLRPKPLDIEARTEIEILIHIDDESIAIIDAKNYKEKFILSASLANHMATEYIPNYQGFDGKTVKYFGYVTAAKIGGLSNISKIITKTKAFCNLDVTGSMISATSLLGLLDYCLENDVEISDRREMLLNLLKTNQAYEYYGEVTNQLHLD